MTGNLHAVVHFPELERPGLDEFRRAHDPFAGVIEPHLTLLFPVPADPGALGEHVRRVAAGFEPFEIHVRGVHKTWDHWLYLAVEEGSDTIRRLHEALYSGPLSEHRRDDLPFEPHIGIGFFGVGPYDPLDPEPVELDEEACRSARRKAEALGVDAWRRVDGLTVVRLPDDPGAVERVERISLGSP